MRRITLILLFFSFTLATFAQVSVSDSRIIKNILGSNFQKLEPLNKYPYSDLCSSCTFIPSITLNHDTTGIVYNNEYLLFRHPLAYTDGREVLKLINTDHVTVQEYMEFQNYVRDSIAREKIYFGASDWTNFYDFLNLSNNKKLTDKEKRDRNGMRQNNTLNWYKRFSYSDPQYIPILADMYLPFPERYYKAKILDDRKIVYRYADSFNVNLKSQLYEDQEYNRVDNVVPTFSNTYLWSNRSTYDRDVWSVHGQVYNLLNVDDKIIGLTGMQVNAFCHWKQVQLQKEFDDSGINYKVVVSTPLKEDLVGIKSKQANHMFLQKDYTYLWKITVGEYDEFIQSVQDSILVELLYSKIQIAPDRIKLLKYVDLYFDEGALEFVELDENDYILNRSMFNLNFSKKIVRKYSSEVAEIKNSKQYNVPIFIYWKNDTYSRSIVGNLVPDGRWQEGRVRDSMYFILNDIDSLGEPVGLDMSFGNINVLGHSSGVRTHQNFRRFYYLKEVTILPKQINESDKKALIQGLTYEQALAFYYWKYPIQFAKEGDDWHQYVIPSKGQFESVQRGETVIMPEQKMEYPSPVFRYVVHVFPKTQ